LLTQQKRKWYLKLYVGNLVYTMTEQDLGTLFDRFGELTSVQIITDHYTRQSKCFGYVEMASDFDGRRAIAAMDGKEVGSQRIIVRKARSREQRQGAGW
jgi:RNA recognition motif-containing protein